MPGGSGRFRRANRLLSPKDFQRVSREGRRVSSRAFVLLWAPSRSRDAPGARLGITVSRSVGNAVVRNRLKRAVREWYRQASGIPQGIDLLVIARPAAEQLDAREVMWELGELVERAGAEGLR